MSRVFLRSISIEGFRGINNIGDPLVLRFRPDCVNSVYAYNGVGKTSIYEAVYYAIFGKVTRLDQLQDAEHGSDYIVNRFHDLQTATIVLSFEPDDGSPGITVSVVKPAAGARAVTSPSGHADPEAFLSSLQEDFVLVDYARFTSFVECSPLHRGRSFSALVGLSQYSNLRQALEGAKDTRSFNTDFGQPALDTEIAGIERSAGTTRQAIAQSYETATGKPSAELPEFSLAADQVTAVLKGTPALASYAGEGGVLALDFETAEREIEKIDGGPERQKWAALLETASSLEKAALGPGEVAEIEGLATLGGERDGAVQRAGRADTLALLKSADKVYKDHAHDDPLQCPLCLSRLTEPLPERIRAQIAHYEEADGFSRRLCAEVKASTALQRLGTLEGMAVLRVAQPDRLAALLLAQAQAGDVKSVSLTAASAAVRNLEARRTAVLDETRTAAATAEASIPPSLVTVTKLLSAAKQFRDGISRHTRETAPLAEKKRRASLIKRWRDFLTAATERFCEAEGRLSTTRLEEIKTVYQRLYGDIMRGGPNLQPTLARANGSENLDLVLADFFGLPNLNARALLSESYRNAVATSIFLAAASKHSGTPRFIILDDVTSSFDAGHQVALMETLRTDLRHPANPDGPQFILLSHDTALEKYFDRLGGTTGWHHQRLQGMPPVGRVMAAAQEADRLKAQALQFLNAGQVDVGAPFVRQYLEYKLGFIISKLKVPVPPDYTSRPHNRTLSTYMDAITDAVSLYQAATRCILSAQQQSDLLGRHAIALTTNFISHYESGTGVPYSAYSLIGVLQTIDDFSDCFTWNDPAKTPPKRFYRDLENR